ncbi:AAA family ATPase [Streptomyces bathyalis]|uniref:AAA family ATPase n=1 Tax=Streptomyces bathyalis TaxID=2710756 RepID=UPI001FE4ECCE|nr:AAA family ATPase [Streptomyces bathyalis]
MGSLRSAYATVTGWGYSPSGQAKDAADSPVRAAAPPPAPVETAVAGTQAPVEAGATAVPADSPPPAASVDLRGTAARRTLRYPTGDRVVVSGLPGSGKSTLIRRVLALQDTVRRIDSQDVRERWGSALPRWLPYAAYRPLARIAHYAGLRRALSSGASVVVHDCGSQAWVRNWLGRDALRRGRALHLVLLDVPVATALRSQAERGRTVSGYAFMRHRRAVRRLIVNAESGRLPRGCQSVVLLDRGAAGALAGISFE